MIYFDNRQKNAFSYFNANAILDQRLDGYCTFFYYLGETICHYSDDGLRYKKSIKLENINFFCRCYKADII